MTKNERPFCVWIGGNTEPRILSRHTWEIGARLESEKRADELGYDYQVEDEVTGVVAYYPSEAGPDAWIASGPVEAFESERQGRK